MITKEQYESIKDIWLRKSLYPKEVDAMFDLFEEVEFFSAGCRSCSSNLTFVQDRLTPKIQEYLDKEEAAAQAKADIQKEKEKEASKKKTTNKK